MKRADKGQKDVCLQRVRATLRCWRRRPSVVQQCAYLYTNIILLLYIIYAHCDVWSPVIVAVVVIVVVVAVAVSRREFIITIIVVIVLNTRLSCVRSRGRVCPKNSRRTSRVVRWRPPNSGLWCRYRWYVRSCVCALTMNNRSLSYTGYRGSLL